MTLSTKSADAILIAILLGSLILFQNDYSSWQQWGQIFTIGWIYRLDISLISECKISKKLQLLINITIGLLVVAVWLIFNQLTGLYVIGSLSLILIGVQHLLSTNPRTSLTTNTLTCCAAMLLALVITPPTVSRVQIDLAKLPVPGKFRLVSDPNIDHSHMASRGYPNHILQPVEVQLSANNVALSEPMPWLEFLTRRDTRFSITGIHYKFINFDIYELSGVNLHSLKLADRSDDVSLEHVDDGINISNIGAGESAWIQLPSLDTLKLGPMVVFKLTAIRVSLWLLVCLLFSLWYPSLSRQRESI
jgi:hypothetical protein